MTKLKFTVLVDEVFNEFDCKLLGLEYNEEGICKVNYTNGFRNDLHLYVICNYVFINSNYYTISILNNMYSRR